MITVCFYLSSVLTVLNSDSDLHCDYQHIRTLEVFYYLYSVSIVMMIYLDVVIYLLSIKNQ